MFPLIAVERIKAAHLLMRDVPGLHAIHALEALRDDVVFPAHPADSSAHHALVLVMNELSALRAELAQLQSEVSRLQALLWVVVSAPEALPLSGDELTLTEPGAGVPMGQTSPRRAQTAHLQPSLTRLLSDLEAGYTLSEVRGGGGAAHAQRPAGLAELEGVWPSTHRITLHHADPNVDPVSLR